MKHATKVVVLGVALALAGATRAEPVNGGDTGTRSASVVAIHRIQHAQIPPGVVVDGVNNDGWIIGHWTDRNGVSHIFLLNPFVPALSNIAVHDDTPAVMLDNNFPG
jgi:hypothetical protein